VSAPAWLGFAAGSLAALGCAELARLGAGWARRRAPRAAAAATALAAAFTRVGNEGRDPGAADRRRLLLAGGGAGALLGLLVIGPLAAVLLGAGGPWATARVLRARREHYRRAVEAEAPALALALADSLAAGHSLRGALTEAGRGLGGPARHELRRVAAELTAGAGTDTVLAGLRDRLRSARIDTLVAACLVQRRAGGDLAGLLRECAEAFGDEARLRDEVRAATAQARFTGLVVVLMPVAGAVLAELASPGFFVSLWGSFLTAWLLGVALALQVVAAVLIRRLGRVRW
jgi:tight adherence protein B